MGGRITNMVHSNLTQINWINMDQSSLTWINAAIRPLPRLGLTA
jgi:hypothetical protein